MHLLSGITVHPNVAGFVLVLSGSEDYHPSELTIKANRLGKSFFIVSAQEEKSAAMLIRKGKTYTDRLVRESLQTKRVNVDINSLRIGLNCAGTDKVSAQTSNLVCGAAVDRIVKDGWTVVASEIPDLIGLGSKYFDR